MKIKMLLVCLALATACHAQKKAITETGEEVILNENGTWEYAQKTDTAVANPIETNPVKIVKAKNASFLLKSAKVDIGIWLDPKKWSFKKSQAGSAAEFSIELKNQDLYAMLITEKIEIPLESLKSVALENAKEAASDITLIHEEYRMVNGLKVLEMQMAGTLKGIKFTYYGYYYSFPGGTIQFVTYTSMNLFKGYQKDAEEILSGLVITE